MKVLSCAIALLLAIGCAANPKSYSCSFAKGEWNAADWTLVKSARWEHFGAWVQRDGHIENQTPADATASEMLGSRAGETYTSMVLKRKFGGDVVITTTTAFADRMAPLIVIASELGQDAEGRAEYRDHYEIVIFDEGVNLWRHVFKDGKPSWVRAAHAEFPLRPNVRYEVRVSISDAEAGKRISVLVAGRELQYVAESVPESFHVGITGCEGVNRFYDFNVQSADVSERITPGSP